MTTDELDESPAGDDEDEPKRQPSKKKEQKWVKPPMITVDMYNALWRAYQDEPDYRKAGKAAGVRLPVAKWYCDGPAWPAVGFVQLAGRLRAIQGMVADLNDHGTAKWRSEQLKVLTEGLRTTAAGLAIHQRGVREMATKVQSGELPAEMVVMSKEFSLTKVVDAHNTLLRAALLTMGEADSLTGTVDAPQKLNFSEWTADECKAYAERQIVPERFKK
ncbi:MAG: hypothetical protein PHX83_06560 [Acidobacteriia bacterium]|nr:hypothetical protein [Terriglobia bacterium]